MALVVVTGGTRSGKSELAERLAHSTGAAVLYLATQTAGDSEIAERIAWHRDRRPASWETIETTDVCGVLCGHPQGTIIVDSVGPWIACRMAQLGLFTDADFAPLGDEGRALRARLIAEVESVARAAASRPALTVCVCEEAGLGPVACGASTRRYLDLLGEANQTLAKTARQVLFCVSGRVVDLAQAPPAVKHVASRPHGDSMVPAGCVDFAVNVEPDRPEWLSRALADALADSTGYPTEAQAVAAIADRHGRRPEEVVPTNGATEALWLVANALTPRHAVCVHPSFTEPEAALDAHGIAVERVFRRPEDFALDCEAVPPGSDLVITTNPNNPSGRLDSAAEVASLSSPDRTLVVDEAFMDFVAAESQSLAHRSDLCGLVVVRSLTKAFGLAGIRAGYLLAAPELASRLRAARPPWSVNSLALAAMVACCNHTAALRAVRQRVGRRRRLLSERLAALEGVTVWPSQTNFVLCHVPGAERLSQRLVDAGMAVRRAGDFPGLDSDYLRIAVRKRADTERLVATLDRLLQ